MVKRCVDYSCGGGGGFMLLPFYICILLNVSRVQRKTVYIIIVYNNSCATSYTLCDERTLYITLGRPPDVNVIQRADMKDRTIRIIIVTQSLAPDIKCKTIKIKV